MEEKWKDIQGYEGLYQVSTLGRVKSLERKVKWKNGYKTVSERILKPSKYRGGYLKVILSNECEIKTISVHRLVCEAFLPNTNNFPEINHKDECKTNNNVNNLEWCSHIYNSNYGTRNERSAKANSKTKTGVYNTKISKAVMQIETGIIFPSTMEVHRQLGFNQSHISQCCNGKLKSAYKYHWKYVD